MHRFYNTVLGVHLYTANQEEANQVVARLSEYNYEGVAYQAHGEKVSGTTELYRFYNTHTGAHFYTAGAEEMESVRINLAGSFNYEGVAYYVDIV